MKLEIASSRASGFFAFGFRLSALEDLFGLPYMVVKIIDGPQNHGLDSTEMIITQDSFRWDGLNPCADRESGMGVKSRPKALKACPGYHAHVVDEVVGAVELVVLVLDCYKSINDDRKEEV